VLARVLIGTQSASEEVSFGQALGDLFLKARAFCTQRLTFEAELDGDLDAHGITRPFGAVIGTV
jgi:hypothetical protein